MRYCTFLQKLWLLNTRLNLNSNNSDLIIGSGNLGNLLFRYLFNCDSISSREFIKDPYIIKKEYKNIFFTGQVTRRMIAKPNIYQFNLSIVEKILRHCKVLNKFYFISSIDVYGNPVKENYTTDLPLQSIDDYSKSKIDSEMLLRDKFEENFLAIRIPGLYGIPNDSDSVPYRMISSLINNGYIQITDPKITRPFLSYFGLCQTIKEISENYINKPFLSNAINVGPLYSVSLLDLSKLICKVILNEIDEDNYPLKIDESIDTSEGRKSNISIDWVNNFSDWKVKFIEDPYYSLTYYAFNHIMHNKSNLN